LFLCLMGGKMDMILLSQLLKSPEAVDALILFPITLVDSNTISIEEKYLTGLLQNFRWSEKVKASGILAQKFQKKFFDNEKLGDLWLMAGDKEKAKSTYFLALDHYKKDQLHSRISSLGERMLIQDILSQE